MALHLCSWSFVLALMGVGFTSEILVHPVHAARIENLGEKYTGYEVTTVIDGNKIGVSLSNIYEADTGGGTYAVALDSSKSNILRISLPFSQNSAVERISGSPEGKAGYRDGGVHRALFNHPKKLTLDPDGNIYVADPRNGAVRMITTQGLVTTIAGGSNQTGHHNGEGSEVTFSTDFDVTYLGSTCKLAVADMGNRMVREIELPHFAGRCHGATPNYPGSMFTWATILMSLVAGIIGIVAGAIGTILTLSSRRLEQLQSTLHWEGTGINQRPPLVNPGEDYAAFNNNPRAFEALNNNPRAFEALNNNPRAFEALNNNPRAFEALNNNPRAFEALNNDDAHEYKALNNPEHEYEALIGPAHEGNSDDDMVVSQGQRRF